MFHKTIVATTITFALTLSTSHLASANDSGITDLSSGEPVTLTTASWERKNIETRPIICEGFNWSSSLQTYSQDSSGTTIYYHSPLDTDGTVIEEQIFNTHTFNASLKRVNPWNLSNGTYTGPGLFARRPEVEIVSVAGGFKNATRVWFSSNKYELCTAFPASGTFIPTGNLPECIDTAPIGDGWGWDGSDSCKILSDDQLGFGQCDVHYDNLPIGECIDVFPEGDGWGWNGVYSCEL